MRIGIVDGNNLSYKIFAVFKESRGGLLTNSAGIPTTVIFGLLRTFTDLANKTKFDKIVICWDTSGSYYRREIFPSYKKHRNYTDMKAYFEELDSAREHLKSFGFNQVIAKGIEADDVIGFLANKLSKEKHSVIVISDDKDFYQIVKRGIKIWRPIKNCMVSLDEVLEANEGLCGLDLARMKAITGEDTDLIPGVCAFDEKLLSITKCGLGEKTAIKIIKNKKNLKDAINTCELVRWKDLLKEREKQILMSFKLARIRTKEIHYLDWEKELLKNIEVKVMKDRRPSIKRVNRLKQFLEIKSFNIVSVLRTLGIKLKGDLLK